MRCARAGCVRRWTVVIQNPKLQALYSEINRLSDEDQQALVILLDSLVKRSQMGKVLAS